MDLITHEVRQERWLQLINQCNNSGLTRKEWCRQNGINLKTFYYWQRRFRQEAYITQLKSNLAPAMSDADVTFAEVTVPVTGTKILPQEPTVDFRPDAVIRTGTLTIELSGNASGNLLSLIEAVIKHAT